MEGRANVDSITICHSQSRSDRPKYSAETEAGTIKEFFPPELNRKTERVMGQGVE